MAEYGGKSASVRKDDDGGDDNNKRHDVGTKRENALHSLPLSFSSDGGGGGRS
jgi:hypothetical protein